MGLPFATFGLEAKNIAERPPHVYFKVLPGEHRIIQVCRETYPQMTQISQMLNGFHLRNLRHLRIMADLSQRNTAG
jgi:hypothetical protein